MIELLDELPDDVLGFRFSGHVTRDEYTQTLLPVLKQRVDGDGKIRMLVVIDDAFEKFEAGALWEDAKFGLGSGLMHLGKWERTALVSDTEWARHAIGLFGWMVPGDIRVFPLAELDAAIAWLDG
jgi:hypothetical protein